MGSLLVRVLRFSTWRGWTFTLGRIREITMSLIDAPRSLDNFDDDLQFSLSNYITIVSPELSLSMDSRQIAKFAT